MATTGAFCRSEKNFPKLSITYELLNQSSKKLHMHNFRCTTLPMPRFKEIALVVSEEFSGQIFVYYKKIK